MNYHAHRTKRDKLPIPGLPSLEKKMQRELKSILIEQTREALTPSLLEEAVTRWKMIHRKDQEQMRFEQFLHELFARSYALLHNSTYSQKIQDIIYLYYLQAIRAGVIYGKRSLTSHLLETKNDRFKPTVQQTKTTGFNLTNPKVLEKVRIASQKQASDIVDTSVTRVSNYVRDEVMAGGDEGDVLDNTGDLEDKQSRRSWNISRDTLIEGALLGAFTYYSERGLQKWQWVCQSPIDSGCTSACGSVVEIGQSFPNGLSEPPVHKNCACVTVDFISDNVDEQNIQADSFDEGSDWGGE